jgi:hypothetical protein
MPWALLPLIPTCLQMAVRRIWIELFPAKQYKIWAAGITAGDAQRNRDGGFTGRASGQEKAMFFSPSKH